MYRVDTAHRYRYLKDISMTWEEAQQLAVDTGFWRRSVAQSV